MNNTWNLWVLWNGDYPTGNGTAWRRFTSSDLINWTDQGVSIPKYSTAYGDCWTGSTVADVNNAAGYGAGAIIALMTMPCNNLGGQSTALWYSTNGGASFQFGAIVQANPQAGNTSVSDPVFRDPNIFWHAPSSHWVMILAEIGKISIYTSSNLKNWIYCSAMSRSDLGTLECPNLIQLHLHNADGSVAGDKWVLFCGANGTAQGFTNGTHYWVGQFDGVTFTPDSWNGQWLDGGPDCYATALFADANAADPLAFILAISWENNWDYAKSMPTSGYFGQLSTVRQLRLQMVNGSPILLNTPVATQDNVFKSSLHGLDQTISDTTPYNWPSDANSISSRIDFTLSQVNRAWPTGIYLSVRGGDNYFTQVGFEPPKNSAFLKRVKCGPAPTTDGAWNNVYNTPCDFSASVQVSVFVDAGSVEVFVNNGSISMSALITAPSDAVSLNLTASGGSVRVSSLVVKKIS